MENVDINTLEMEGIETSDNKAIKKMMIILSKATLDNVYASFILANGYDVSPIGRHGVQSGVGSRNLRQPIDAVRRG